ncbi:MAG: hypothetical protein ED556_02060 [Winogradskyella sp.]|uniref:DUF6090 family protein n=1 Tax=Winogradskyella sp. TaxID=1883156 RepID=UPI000F3DBC29|nr:DUF6090 family protein [Winogradskyella sp.]RNC87997.1 MAG: hypothetical protein ED556_02060 [Winogradskyella sp.]
MIKFFRHIRRTLIQENKMGKYFKYAIGEIILVMIGILLALQINNWNDHRKSVSDSKILINEMINDLASDTLYLENAETKLKRRLKLEEWILFKTSYTLKDMDSIKMAIDGGYFDFYINDRTFQKIQNSAQSKLIGFDNLYKAIADYYTITKKRIEKNTEYEIRETTRKDIGIWDKFAKEIEIDAVFNTDYTGRALDVTFPKIKSTDEQNQKIIDLISTIEARNYLKQNYGRHLFLFVYFRDTNKKAKALISDIQKALEDD